MNHRPPSAFLAKVQSPTLALYINREFEIERRASIESQLLNAGITGERICGVEGLAVPPAFTDYFFENDELHSKLRPGEVGCYASHLYALSIVVERGVEHALILEDDAIFSRELAEALVDVIPILPSGWDFVYLYGLNSHATKPVTTLNHSRTLVRYSRVPRGTVAYLISRQGAEKFLTPVKRFWPIDTDLRQPWRFNLQIYGVTPPPVDHQRDRFPSTIANGAERSRLRRGLPIPSRHCWTGNPLHTPQGLYFNLKTLGPRWWTKCWTQNVRRRIANMNPLRR